MYLWSNFECQIHVLFLNSLALNAIEFLAFIKYMKHIGTNIIINAEHCLWYKIISWVRDFWTEIFALTKKSTIWRKVIYAYVVSPWNKNYGAQQEEKKKVKNG